VEAVIKEAAPMKSAILFSVFNTPNNGYAYLLE
jgi:hypothetical protein